MPRLVNPSTALIAPATTYSLYTSLDIRCLHHPPLRRHQLANRPLSLPLIYPDIANSSIDRPSVPTLCPLLPSPIPSLCLAFPHKNIVDKICITSHNIPNPSLPAPHPPPSRPLLDRSQSRPKGSVIWNELKDKLRHPHSVQATDSPLVQVP